MAYSKTTWNNLSSPPINADNLNKIEQGIYDNSLGIDKINPSGTATTTAEIEEGQITDVIGFKSLKLKGQTSQYTTTGKNLLAIKQLTTQTINGVTFTPHYTGNKLDYVNVNGTATATAGYYLDNANVDQPSTYTNELPSGTYILSDFSGSTSPNAAIFFRYPTGSSTFTTIDSAENSRKLTMDSTFKYTSYIRINNGATVNNMKFYPQLETGSTQTTYEPYTNGASPNPDFPSDVNNVSGDNIVGISNKNIARLELEGQVRGYTNGIPHASSGFNGYIANVKPNTTYVSSCQNISTEYNKISNLCYFDENMNFLSGNAYNGQNKTFTTPANCKYVSMAVNQAVVNFQLEQSSSATSFIAHQGNNFEIKLSGNLIEDETFVQGGATNNTSTDRISCRNVQLKANTTYTLSSDLNYSNFNIAITYATSKYPLPSGTNTIYDSGWKTASITFTTGDSNVYSNIIVRKPNNANLTPSDVSGNHFQLEEGSATSYAPYFPPIELCKIGTYQDYIYKKDGKWWKHKEVEKITLNGSETPTINTALTNTTRALYSNILPYNSKGGAGSCICNLLPYYENWVTDVEGFYLDNNTTNLVFRINKSTVGTTITSVNNFLSENNMTVYYIVETAIEEEITYTPLIRQLDEVYNSGLYDVTNISQDNSSEAFILDMEACKNNINGIVEYIRR